MLRKYLLLILLLITSLSCKRVHSFLKKWEKDRISQKEDREASSSNIKVDSFLHSKVSNNHESLTKRLADLKVENLNSIKPRNLGQNYFYALDVKVDIPRENLNSESGKFIQDNDLITAWKCILEKEKSPCLVRFILPEALPVYMIRIFAGSGENANSYRNHGRVKTIRFYVDDGWFEAKLRDEMDFQYLLFRNGVITRQIDMEIVEFYPGKTDNVIHVAEVEIFGTNGKSRTPLIMNNEKMVVKIDVLPWISKNEGMDSGCNFKKNPSSTWIEEIEENGNRKRLFKGSAIFTDEENCCMLVENLFNVECSMDGLVKTSGVYFLYDGESRMYYEVGELGGMRGQIYVHPEVCGFATVGINEEGKKKVGSVVLFSRGPVVEVENDLSDEEVEYALKRRGFVRDDKVCCEIGEGGKRDDNLCAHISGKDAMTKVDSVPGQEWREIAYVSRKNQSVNWIECNLKENMKLLISNFDECEQIPNIALLVNSERKIQESMLGVSIDAVEFDNGIIFFEMTKKEKQEFSSIYKVEENGKFLEVFPHSSFTLKLPQKCRCPKKLQ